MRSLILICLLACGAEQPKPAAEATEAAAPRRTDVDVATFATAHAAGVSVVDVRTPDEYAAGHVPGAVNVPIEGLDVNDPVFVAHGKEAPVYLVCASGRRSSRAADLLAEAGYTVVNVEGGTQAWIAAGHPTAP